MYIKSIADLIYTSQSKNENGSPVELEIIKEKVKVNEAETFSNRYYTDEQRLMRLSRNLIVPTYYVKDIQENGLNYELSYVNYEGKRYKVRNILKVKNTRLNMLLDIQELR